MLIRFHIHFYCNIDDIQMVLLSISTVDIVDETSDQQNFDFYYPNRPFLICTPYISMDSINIDWTVMFDSPLPYSRFASSVQSCNSYCQNSGDIASSFLLLSSLPCSVHHSENMICMLDMVLELAADLK